MLRVGQALEVQQRAGPRWLLLNALTKPCGNSPPSSAASEERRSQTLCGVFLHCARQLEEGFPRRAAAGLSTDHSWVTTSITDGPQRPATAGKSLRKAWGVGNYKVSTGFIF